MTATVLIIYFTILQLHYCSYLCVIIQTILLLNFHIPSVVTNANPSETNYSQEWKFSDVIDIKTCLPFLGNTYTLAIYQGQSLAVTNEAQFITSTRANYKHELKFHSNFAKICLTIHWNILGTLIILVKFLCPLLQWKAVQQKSQYKTANEFSSCLNAQFMAGNRSLYT